MITGGWRVDHATQLSSLLEFCVDVEGELQRLFVLNSMDRRAAVPDRRFYFMPDIPADGAPRESRWGVIENRAIQLTLVFFRGKNAAWPIIPRQFSSFATGFPMRMAVGNISRGCVGQTASSARDAKDVSIGT